MAVRPKISLTANVGEFGDGMVGTEEKKEEVSVNFGYFVILIWKFRVPWAFIVLNVFHQNYLFFTAGAMR